MSDTRFLVLGCVLAGILACHDEPTAPIAPGPNAAAQALTRVPLQFLQVSTGYWKGCGVTTDHRAYCWRVGKWSPGNQPFVAYPVPGALRFQQVSVSKADDEHFCGITTDSLAYCWGNNESGQLGNGTLLSSATPVAVAGGRRFLSITVGAGFTCARNLNNLTFCWGANTFAQIGSGLYTGDPTTPMRVRTPKLFSVVNAGLEHVCALTADGHAYCWGRDDVNQLGDGTAAHRSDSVPMPVAGARLYKKIDAAVDHSCALSTSNAAFCWGLGPGLGDGSGTAGSQPVPFQVVGGLKFTQLSAALDHTCALTLGGQTYCWGRFLTGQVNGSMPVISWVPVPIMTDYRFTQISTGAQLTCGITPNGRAICWGLGWDADGRPHQIHALM